MHLTHPGRTGALGQLLVVAQTVAGGLLLLSGTPVLHGLVPVASDPVTRCFAGSSQLSREADVAPAVADGATSAAAPADPLNACVQIWRQGVLGGASVSKGGDPVPALSACRLPDGSSAVFRTPAGESDAAVCSAAGAAPWRTAD